MGTNNYSATKKPKLNVTSIEKLRDYAQGQIVQLPSFGANQEFYARLKRPSMLALAESGKIPNALLVTANQLFEKGGAGFNAEDENIMPAMLKVIREICAAAFVEPTYNELQENGIELTDEQLMFVFQYTQVGVNALQSFRG